MGPQQDRLERRLTALLAADAAGYSRLMGLDERATLRSLSASRKIMDALIAEHGGRIANTAGDSVLAEFPSVVDAVECATAVQEGLREMNAGVSEDRALRFRIGIHVGDVIVRGADLLGDGVNIAARVQSLAEPGSVWISGKAYEEIEGKVGLAFEDRGEQQVKNIARPVRIYALAGGAVPRSESRPLLALPDKPSIAVLPFTNMSRDPEQDYFADGVVEDIITALSRFRWLFVIARNSSFAYKGRAVDVKHVGHELGVRYVLEGSVRKAAQRLRITGQLIEGSTGAHLWADRFDGTTEDVFDLQDRVAIAVVTAIAPKLEQAETDRARRTPTERLDAYDYYLRGRAAAAAGTKPRNDEALRLLYKAIELDPDFASAWGMAARCYTLRHANSWMVDGQEVAETKRLARRAVELGRDDAVALCMAGWALARVLHEMEEGASHIERALTLNPNLAAGWQYSGLLQAYLGNPELAASNLARAMRLSPLDTDLYAMQAGTALAEFVAGRYEESARWAEMALREQPNFFPALRNAATSHALAGRLDQARQALGRVLQADPELRVSNVPARVPLRRPADLARYQEGLRLAGLPE